MSNITKLPTAAPSYYTVRKAGQNFDVSLVTPCGSKLLVTRLRRWADRDRAIEDAIITAVVMQRPFKEGRM